MTVIYPECNCSSFLISSCSTTHPLVTCSISGKVGRCAGVTTISVDATVAYTRVSLFMPSTGAVLSSTGTHIDAGNSSPSSTHTSTCGDKVTCTVWSSLIHATICPFVINTIVSWFLTSFRIIVADILTRWSSVTHSTIFSAQDPIISDSLDSCCIFPHKTPLEGMETWTENMYIGHHQPSPVPQWGSVL